MPLEPMQCPKCGSPLQVEPSAGVVFCNYCGSRLRLTRGSSGHPMGVLDEIRNDTAILAHRTAIDHLQESLPALYARRDALKEKVDWLAAVGTPPRPLVSAKAGSLARALTLLAALVALLLLPQIVQSMTGGSADDKSWATAMAKWIVGPCLVVALAGATVWWMSRVEGGLSRAAASEARSRWLELKPGLATLEEEIRSTEARIDELKAEMDRLAREV